MNDWSRRIRPPAGPPELQQIRDAAQELAQQASRAPGKARVVFQTVADCAMIGTVVVSGALASIHLWKALFSTHSGHAQAPGNADNESDGHRRTSQRSQGR